MLETSRHKSPRLIRRGQICLWRHLRRSRIHWRSFLVYGFHSPGSRSSRYPEQNRNSPICLGRTSCIHTRLWPDRSVCWRHSPSRCRSRSPALIQQEISVLMRSSCRSSFLRIHRCSPSARRHMRRIRRILLQTRLDWSGQRKTRHSCSCLVPVRQPRVQPERSQPQFLCIRTRQKQSRLCSFFQQSLIRRSRARTHLRDGSKDQSKTNYMCRLQSSIHENQTIRLLRIFICRTLWVLPVV